MLYSKKDTLYELLRIALDDGDLPCSLSRKLNAAEWNDLHLECIKQLIASVIYRAICRLPRDQQPPLEIAFQWAGEAETVKGQNKLLNEEAARLTELFASQGRKTAVLKGPANARLYPDPYMRQAGDIDLWVEGGRESVFDLLKKMGYQIPEEDFGSSHHVHLYPAKNGIIVEIHYRPCTGTWNPFTRGRLLRYLEEKIPKAERVDEGFYAPSMKFALAMQLTHIQRHFVGEGIGFKQIIDYYILLKNSSEDDRREIASRLSYFGLAKVCRALMWIMGYVFGLDKSKMLCEPDEKYGKKMLAKIHNDGNFGVHAVDWAKESSMNFIVRWFKHRWGVLRNFWFAPVEVLGCELQYFIVFFKSIGFRIKRRKLSIWSIYHTKYVKNESND